MSATDSRPALPIHLPFDSTSSFFSKNTPCVFQVLGSYLTSLGEMPCGWLLCTYVRSRWGQRLGQKEVASENNNLCKTKILEIVRFRGFLARREGFEPPAFWSVGCLTRKSESFRLRFAVFATVRSADLPLFPSSPACFFRILGQKWVKEESSCFSKTPQYLLQFPPKRLSAVRHPSAAACPKRI